MLSFEDLNLDAPAKTRSNFNFSDFAANTVIESLNVITLSFFLYPFQRVQQIRQVQNSYSCETFIVLNLIRRQARCSHYGFRSTFRGLKAAIIKNSMLYSVYRFIDKYQYQPSKMVENIIKGLVASAGYLIIYPLENIKLRMGADLQRERYYSNIRNCYKKVKKQEGLTAFYRGFSVGALLIVSQFTLIKTLVEINQKYKDLFQNTMALTGLFLTSFTAYETILYPLDTLKKQIQISGSLGHDDYNKNIRQTIKNMTFANYFSGFQIRLLNSFTYILLSIMVGRIEKQY